jgi:penicillin-binding protein 1A
MDRALRGVPVASLAVPDGLTDSGGDWLYSEFIDGSYVRSIGMDPAADAAAEAASAPSAGVPPPTPAAPSGPAASGH